MLKGPGPELVSFSQNCNTFTWTCNLYISTDKEENGKNKVLVWKNGLWARNAKVIVWGLYNKTFFVKGKLRISKLWQNLPMGLVKWTVHMLTTLSMLVWILLTSKIIFLTYCSFQRRRNKWKISRDLHLKLWCSSWNNPIKSLDKYGKGKIMKLLGDKFLNQEIDIFT